MANGLLKKNASSQRMIHQSERERPPRHQTSNVPPSIVSSLTRASARLHVLQRISTHSIYDFEFLTILFIIFFCHHRSILLSLLFLFFINFTLIFLIPTLSLLYSFFFFFNDTAPPEIYPFPLHDALPIKRPPAPQQQQTHEANPPRPRQRARRQKNRKRRNRHTNLLRKHPSEQNDIAMVQQEFECAVHWSWVPRTRLG